MILITGGAGFIGSVLQARLWAAGRMCAVADSLGDQGKWRNLANHPPALIVPPDGLEPYLAAESGIEAVVHLGAVTDTTATDGDLAWSTNVALPQMLWRWCAENACPFLYASSAATYGDGRHGFDDDGSLDYLNQLRPLNLYGWTKHAFDVWVARMLQAGLPAPPQWAGLKFFNVYGPNEYHKGGMVSVVKVKHDEVLSGARPRLFRSDRQGVADGQQKRDFIWVGDVVDVIVWLLATPTAQGLFNVGSGQARSYLDLANAVCRASEQEEGVEFIDMPPALRGQYQSFTEAKVERLRTAGYARPFTPLEQGIGHYVRDYLRGSDMYL